MTFNFTVKEFIIGNGTSTPTLQFYKRGFELNSGGESPSWQDIILSGTTALTLTNALANGLNYLKLFGDIKLLSEQYLDTVTLSGGCEQGNLPSGYVQNQFIWMKENSYLLTNIIPTYDGHYELDFQTTTISYNAAAYLGGRSGQSPAGLIFSHGSNNATVTDAFGQRYNLTYRVEDNTHYKYVFNNKVFTLYKNGEVVETHTFTSSTNSGAALAIKAINMGDSIDFAGEGFYFYGFKAWDNQGQLIADYIPATKLQGLVTGIYDRVTNTFLTAISGEWSSGPALQPTPDTPMDIVCNNGVLKVNRNLYSTEYHDKTLSQSDGITTGTNTGVNVSAMVDCTNVKSFMVTSTNPKGSFRLFKYRPDGTFINAQTTADIGQVLVIPSDCGYFRIQYNYTSAIGTDTENILIYNSAHNLGIYTDGTVEVVTDSLGNTASAERLLTVGDYKDTQEVLNGSVTRNIGVMVLDGTEDWSLTGTSFRFDGNISFAQPNTCLCTHFKGWLSTDSISDMPDLSIKAGHPTNTYRVYARYDKFTTVEQLKSWLADQYANGTPVIIVYPLATATTETVTGQFLSKSPVTQTAGSIDNLPIAITESEKTVPTPQQPLPINCNNGVVKARRPSGLPLGYTLLDYIGSTGTQYIDTGIIPNVTTRVVAKIAFPDVVETVLCWGSRSSGTYQSSLDQFYCGRTIRSLWYYSATTQTGLRTGISPNVFYDIDVTNTCVTATATQSIYLFALNNLGTATTDSSSKIAKFEIYNNGVMVRNLISCKRNSDNVLGMYDLVSGQFLINQGTGTFVAGNTVSDPVEIYTDGTVETINIHGRNLFDTTSIITGYRLSNLLNNTYGIADFAADTSYYVSNLIPVEVGKIYIKNSPVADAYHRFKIYNANKVSVRISSENSITIQNGEAYIAFCGLQTELTTAYCGELLGTAMAEMLLKVGTYQDVQSVLDGSVARNVGVKVLDGTENWQSNVTSKFYLIDNVMKAQDNSPTLCSHYKSITAASTAAVGNGQIALFVVGGARLVVGDNNYTTAGGFKQYLADQYAQGTPVIVVYPLATPTTETVTGQPLTTQAGTNIVEITQASIDNLRLEVSYKATV